jgi:O-acetyl-ADP-ribose deacetylase (regulator of RNase III)
MLDCKIDMLEPVSTIRLLDMPSISTDILGVPCSKVTGTGTFLTAFSGTLR